MKSIDVKTKIISGIDRDYRLSLKKNDKGQEFLSISVQKGNLSKEIIVIENDFADFISAINTITKHKAYDVGEIRQKHKKAYVKWTEEEDEKLEMMYCEEKTIAEMSDFFGRQQNAIQARIKKLELKQKY